jgi:hypothetical protein
MRVILIISSLWIFIILVKNRRGAQKNLDASKEKPMYLAVDPGKGSTDSIGWATFSDEGKLIGMGQDTLTKFIMRLESFEGVQHVVWEEYKIFRKRLQAHANSKVETIQTIGMIKSWAIRNNISWSEQKSEILNPAQNLFQIKMPADHRESHQVSALLHGLHYLWTIGLIKTALEEQHMAKTG